MEPTALLSLAEAYLVVSPTEAISILEANPELTKENKIVVSFLKAFAAMLLGLKEVWEEQVAILRQSENTAKEVWEITELREFLKWGKVSGELTEMQHSALSKLIKESGWSETAD
jgi:hypothetical protein